MRFAVCNEMFQNWKWENIVNKVAEIGYTGIEIAPFTFAESVYRIDGAMRDRIRKVAQNAGLEIVGLHWLLAGTEGLHVNHPDESVREKTSKYLVELVRLCGELGGKVLVFGSPKQRDVTPGVSFEDAWRWAVETIRPAVEEAGKYGINFCMESLPKNETNFINTVEEAIKFAKELQHPNAKIVLDVKSMCAEGKDISQLIKSAEGWAAHVHANDANRRGPGFGNVDFRPIAKALDEIEYAGFVSVEVFDFSPDPVTIAGESLNYLKKCFGE